jgi:uncharacterized protein YecE (DUF72 family)
VGGWSYEPWCGTFYPDDLPAKRQLEYASRRLTTIEINATFYRTQTPASFQKWAAETPDDFVFAVKAHRMATTRKTPAEMRDSIDWFLNSGVLELGDKLGPVNWQFPPFRRFDAAYFHAFLGLLPHERAGRGLRHAVEVRHLGFQTPEFVDLLREHDVAVVFTDAEDWPTIPDPTSDFVYARLQRTKEDVETGYTPEELDYGAAAMKAWAEGGAPPAIPPVSSRPAPAAPRDVFVFMISGAKVRAPAAAQALLARL